jgi:hypothetical protein
VAVALPFFGPSLHVAAPVGSLWNRDCKRMTPAETRIVLILAVYGMATASTLVIGYLAWRKIRLRRHRFHSHQAPDGHRKGVWGWE